MESSESPRSHFTASKSHSSGTSRPSPKCAPKPNAIRPDTGVKNVPLGNPATATLRGRCPFLRCVTNAEAGKSPLLKRAKQNGEPHGPAVCHSLENPVLAAERSRAAARFGLGNITSLDQSVYATARQLRTVGAHAAADAGAAWRVCAAVGEIIAHAGISNGAAYGKCLGRGCSDDDDGQCGK